MTETPRDATYRSIARSGLDRLLEGNRRFAEHRATAYHLDDARRAELLEGQYPVATVLGCVDSRVPPELIFDEGIGDLLCVRTAGQALEGGAMGSVEFGVRVLEVPLVVVLGHTGCGAVAAALSEFRHEGHLGDLTGEVAGRLGELVGGDPLKATAGNVAGTVAVLRQMGSLLIGDEPAFVVGALYDMATGYVEILDDAGLLADA